MSRKVTLPDELYDKVAEIASRTNVSVDECAAKLVTDGLHSVEYIEARAKRSTAEGFEWALGQIPDVEPEEYDRI